MKNILYYMMVATMTVLVGCSGGYLYTDKPALEFNDFDYGYPVKKSLHDPYVSYIDQGSGDKVLVLIHGLASNAGFWRYTIPELSKSYRVIAVDLPGYGKSEKGNFPYSMKFYAETINKLLNELNIKKCYLVGHSMGGQIGITFALNYPDRLNALLLASPAGIEYFQRGEGDWLRSVITMSGVKNTTEEGIRRNLAGNFYTWSDKWEWMVEERVRMAKGKDFDEFCYTVVRSVNAMLDGATSKKIDQISVPTLIVYGKYDGLIPNPYLNPGFPSDVFEQGKKTIPNCKLVELDKTGHMLMIEDPEGFNAAVINYIQGN